MISDNGSERYNALPKYLLLEKESVYKIADNHINDTKKVERLAAIINIIVDSIVSWLLSSPPTNLHNTFSRIAIIFTVAFLLGIVTVAVLNKYKNSKTPLKKAIATISESESDNTGIFIVAHKDSSDPNEPTKYLTQRYKTTDIPFLLYLHKFSKYRNETNGEFNTDAIRKDLAQKLKIDNSRIEIKYIDQDSSIKTLLNEDHPKLRIYHFYYVRILMSYSNFVRLSKNSSFKTLQELENDDQSKNNNADVIKYLSDNALSISDESFTSQREICLKIIWNITNHCSFNCDICATHAKADDRKELDLAKKKTVLQNILKYGCDNIKQIDFSGGDPLQQNDSISIINDAIQILGNERVCITTTGIGLNNAAHKDNAVDLLYKCEITLDDSIENGFYVRSSDKNYIVKNITAINNHSSHITHLNINVPIINPNLPRENIEKLVNSIATIDVPHKTVTLLRFMPVGAATPNAGSEHYKEDPSTFINYFKKYAKEKGLDYRLQCALRGKYNKDHCNMLEEKIGIDCAGNVFACAWGGYVRQPSGEEFTSISENPFYLGNLTQNDLLTILKSEKAYLMRSQIAKHTSHCRVYNCVCSGEGGFTTDCDPLFQ